MYGVKGKSVLHGLTEFDVIDDDPIDYMHCVLLGVVRKFTSLWFESTMSPGQLDVYSNMYIYAYWLCI